MGSSGTLPQATAITNLIATLGTSTNVAAFYDTSQNATTTSWSAVSGITSGWGTLNITTITGLSAPTLSGGFYTFNGSSQGLCSPSLAGGFGSSQTLVVIGSITGGSGNNIVAYASNNTTGVSIGTDAGSGDWQGRVIVGGTSTWANSTIAIGSSVYVASMACVGSGTTGTIWLAGSSSVNCTTSAITGGTCGLYVGCTNSAGAATGYTACTVATIIILNEVITTAHLNAILTYGETYYGALAA
jgi:hypothetical protein